MAVGLVSAGVSSAAVIYALSRVPGDKRIEFSALAHHYLSRRAYLCAESVVVLALLTQAIGTIVQTAQTFDQLFVDWFGRSCGVEVAPRFFTLVCASETGSASVFGDKRTVVSAGVALLAAVTGPFSTTNLDGLASVQVLAWKAVD